MSLHEEQPACSTEEVWFGKEFCRTVKKKKKKTN